MKLNEFAFIKGNINDIYVIIFIKYNYRILQVRYYKILQVKQNRHNNLKIKELTVPSQSIASIATGNLGVFPVGYFLKIILLKMIFT